MKKVIIIIIIIIIIILLELLCNVSSTNLKFEILRHKTKNDPILQESSPLFDWSDGIFRCTKYLGVEGEERAIEISNHYKI